MVGKGTFPARFLLVQILGKGQKKSLRCPIPKSVRENVLGIERVSWDGIGRKDRAARSCMPKSSLKGTRDQIRETTSQSAPEEESARGDPFYDTQRD